MIPWMRPMWRMKPIFRIKKHWGKAPFSVLTRCPSHVRSPEWTAVDPISKAHVNMGFLSSWPDHTVKAHQYDLCDMHQSQQDGMEQCKRRLWSCSWRSTKCRQHNQPQFNVSVRLRLLHRGQPELRWIVLTHLPVVECCTLYKKSALSAKLAFGN